MNSSEYQPGDVVNGHMLGADGAWHPINAPLAIDRPMKNALGGWSLGLGIASVLFFWVPCFGLLNFVTAPTGIALGFFGRKRVEAGLATNGGVATAGFWLSITALFLTTCVAIYYFTVMGSLTARNSL